MLRDAALRLSGLLLALVAYAAIRHLARDYQVQPHHDPSLADIACAAVGFVGASASAVLILLGERMFDQVAISRRWARRSAADHAHSMGDDAR